MTFFFFFHFVTPVIDMLGCIITCVCAVCSLKVEKYQWHMVGFRMVPLHVTSVQTAFCLFSSVGESSMPVLVVVLMSCLFFFFADGLLVILTLPVVCVVD